MEYNFANSVDKNNFANYNFQEVSEGAQVIKKISFQDPDEENFGRMTEYLKYLKIYNKGLKNSSKETNLNSSQ